MVEREEFTPKPYQPKMISALEHNSIFALFAGMGLGKTAAVLSAYSSLILDGKCKGLLIVAPIRVCNITWSNQVAKWDMCSLLTVANLRTLEGEKAWEEQSANIYLINFELLASTDRTIKCRDCKNDPKLRKLCKKCRGKGKITSHYARFEERFLRGKSAKDIPVDSIVIDEISLIKNRAHKGIKALNRHRHMFKRFQGLTGTPIPNNYLDLWAQMKFLDGGERLGRTYTSYRDRYFESDYMGFNYTLREGAKDEIHEKIKDVCLIMESEDYLEVPECFTIDETINLPPCANKTYNKLKKELFILMKNGALMEEIILEDADVEIEASSAGVLTNKLLQLTGGNIFDSEGVAHVIHDAKIKKLGELLQKHEDEPVLVMTSFTHERKEILKAFPQAEMFKEKDMDRWRAGEIPVWVSDFRSISHGIDGLQDSCRIMVWYSPTWSNERYLQTIARIVRMGQENVSLVYRILCRDTIDEAVVEAVKEKASEEKGLMMALKNLQQLELNKTK